jgi:hypothetical protein
MPGLRLDAFVRPEQTIAEFERDAQRSRQNVWSVLGSRWIARNDRPEAELYGDPWLEGVGADVAAEHPDWLVDARAVVDELERPSPTTTTTRRRGHSASCERRTASSTTCATSRTSVAPARSDVARPPSRDAAEGYEGRGNFIWQYAVNFGPLMQIKAILHGDLGKVWPGYTWATGSPRRRVAKMSPRAPDTGTEHWITVHPHGPDEPGQPVLVRNNSDGSMTVIGGAGGSLNYLRLDKGRRIDDKKGRERGESADEKAKLTAEQPITEEERKQQEKEFKQRQTKARALIERLGGPQAGPQQQLRDYLKAIDYDPDEKHIVHTGTGEGGGRRRRPRRSSATRSSAPGRRGPHARVRRDQRKDGEQSPLIQERQGDFEGMPEGEEKPDEAEPAATGEENPDVESEGVRGGPRQGPPARCRRCRR